MKHRDELSKRKEIFGKPFRDLAGEGIEEDDRITRIGEAAMSATSSVAALIDATPREKAKRYRQKIERRFPALEVELHRNNPTTGITTLIVRRRLSDGSN